MLNNSVEQLLVREHAAAGERFADDFGNIWRVDEDRDGLRLHIEGHPDAWLPYWTAMRISLPGLHRLETH